MLSVNSTSFDSEKTLNAILYACKEANKKSLSFHTVFKILYFADQKHLTRYGSPILDDDYIAMDNGPVPSKAYDGLKALRKADFLEAFLSPFNGKVSLSGNYYLSPLAEPDTDYLSETELECLMESIQENKDKGFGTLTRESHDDAWHNTGRNGKMSILDIAKAGGADEDALSYINEVLENKRCANGLAW